MSGGLITVCVASLSHRSRRSRSSAEQIVFSGRCEEKTAVTEWNEIPDDVWDTDYDQRCDFEAAEYDDEFLDAIMVGIYVHNNTVEIMSPERTREKYKEYAALYEDPNRDKYRSDYYDKHGIVQVDEAYLRRCLESYELDPDETLKEIPEYIWRGFKSERRP